MRSSVLASLALLLVCTSTAAAADVSGKWHAQVPWPGRNLTDFYFTFKADDAKLTGNMVYPLGDSASRAEITDGKVDGDNVSFVVLTKMRDTQMRWNFKGQVQGGEIQFTLEMQAVPTPGAPAAPGGTPAAPAPAAAGGASPPPGGGAAPPSMVSSTPLQFVAKRQ
jgi:hypothetical protein